VKKIIVLALAFCLFATTVYAGYVRGYTRKDGTRVSGYYRSEPNSTKSDNYGRPSSYDKQYNVPAQQRDYDSDGIPNVYDYDDDNDGTWDDWE
jgi:hypothetical protein